jgi:hypothetical protein
MNRSRRSLVLKCLTAAIAVALLAAPTVRAATADSRPVTRAKPAMVQPTGSAKSYSWSDAAVAGGVLAGIVVLGLWGDVAIGGAILGIQLLCAGAAIAARRVSARKELDLERGGRRILQRPEGRLVTVERVPVGDERTRVERA